MTVTCTEDPELLLHRADLLYCLAQVFLPPPPQWTIRDWAVPLLDDLEELAVPLRLDTKAVRDSVSTQFARWTAAADQGQSDTWLVEYARLFLVPPVHISLNAGTYLDGVLGGQSVQMMRSCHEAANIVADERFRDLPDHVALQLEFLARLYERAARGDVDSAEMASEYAEVFVQGWHMPFLAACREAATTVPAAEVFAALAALIGLAARRSEGL